MGVNYIEFPGLGIKLNIDPVAFTLGTLRVHWYGIIIAVAILVALTLALKESKKFSIKEEDMIDMFLIALPVSIVFARLFFVVFKWNELFKNDFWGIFRIWEGGVAIYGAIIGAILSVWIFSKIRKINMWAMVDFACVYLPLAQAIGRWGNFFNQELYGKNTTLPWGMTGSIIKANPDQGINPAIPVHPTFLYECLWDILIFVILLRIRKKNKVTGGVFAWYILLYSFGRFMSEFLRVDDFQSGAIRYNQVFAAVVFTGAVIFLILARKKAHAKIAPEPVGRSAYSDILEKLNESDAPENTEKIIYSNDTPDVLEDNENNIRPEPDSKDADGENEKPE